MTVAGLEERREKTADRVELVALALIDPATDNPRRQIGDVTELAQSIASSGLIQPLVITPREDRYLLVCGARRHAACLVADLDAVTCVIREFTETERQEAMLIENLQREDLAVLEEAESYRRLVELGYTQRQLVDRVGRSQAHISKRLALLELPKQVLVEVDSGGITLEDAQQLGKLVEHPKRLVAAFKRRREWGGLERQVNVELDELKIARKAAAHRAKLESAGIRIVEMKARQSYYPPEMPRGMAIVSPSAYDGVRLDHKKHADLGKGCHAAAIDPRTGDIVYVCTKPSNHGQRTKEQSAEGAKSKRWRQHERDLRAAREVRRSTAGSLLGKGAIAAPAATSLIVDALLFRAEAEAERVALVLLGVEPKTRPSHYGDVVDRGGTLGEIAAKSASDAVRVGLALAIATEEIRFSLSPWSHPWENDRAKAYYELLAGAGYTPSAAEELELAGKGPRP